MPRKVIDKFVFSDWPLVDVRELQNGHVFIAPTESGLPSAFIMVDGFYVVDQMNDAILPVDALWGDGDQVRVIGHQGFWPSDQQYATIALFNQCQLAAMKYWYSR